VTLSQFEPRKTVKGKAVRKELLENQSVGLLQALHLLTRQGDLNADARRKLKQVNHFVGLLQPALDDVFERFAEPLVVDVGSGNAYLGFVLYELFFAGQNTGQLLSIESREALVAAAKARAESLSFGRMIFETASIASAVVGPKIHLLTALHACDTATDDAIALGVSREADYIALVPCCQAEVAQQLKAARNEVSKGIASLFSHPWHKREFGSHLTQVIRALLLESLGYQVTVTELVGWEHSLKNELILAKKVQKENRMAKSQLLALLGETKVKPKSIALMEQQRPGFLKV
jgi:SAM-dependent methyltransferase